MILQAIKSLFNRAHRHDWDTTTIKGGTIGLLYADRVCKGCGKTETRNSRFQWVDPFEPCFQWEREDKASGQVWEAGNE